MCLIASVAHVPERVVFVKAFQASPIVLLALFCLKCGFLASACCHMLWLTLEVLPCLWLLASVAAFSAFKIVIAALEAGPATVWKFVFLL